MLFRLGRYAGSPACGLACAEFIYASGEIRPDTVEALMILQSRVRRPLPVVLNSPGGNLDGALALGRALRKARSDTRVAALVPVDCRAQDRPRNLACTDADQRSGVTVFQPEAQQGLCNSSCVYAFAGGIRRDLAAGSALGVHRFFLTRSDDPWRRPLQRYGKAEVAQLDRTHDAIAAYLTEMGVSADTLRLAAGVEPQDIRHLSAGETAQLMLTTPPPFATIEAAPRPDPTPTGAVRAMMAPAQNPAWLMVQRAGQPFIVVSQPTESRRFGRITTEVAISCTADSGRYSVAFRELIVSRPDRMQDALVRVEPDHFGELARHAAAPTLVRDTALRADERGVLVLEVTSSATAGYPTRLEFPVRGLRDGIERLDKACRR
jgi:hypothetical protein